VARETIVAITSKDRGIMITTKETILRTIFRETLLLLETPQTCASNAEKKDIS